jgi:predicted O-linked N-acetylglucosamine transferase (SPINDLY family)
MKNSLKAAITTYTAEDFEATALILERCQQTSPLPLQGLLILGQSYAKLGRSGEAARCFTAAAKEPGAQSTLLLSLALALLRKAGEDWQAFLVARELHRLDPNDKEAAHVYRHFIHHWLNIEELRQSDNRQREALQRRDPIALDTETLVTHFAWCGDEALNQAVTHMQNATAFTEESRARRRARPHVFGEKPRVGYLSSDLADCHATTILMQGMFDYHDPAALDFTFFCFSSEELIASDFEFRHRHAARIVPIGHLSTQQAHDLIRAHNIDILVDLKGHTMGAWIDLVNSGPAPIQVAYIGFPGSGNGIDCDYILSDSIVTPISSERFYHEKFCLLPESYQPNDNLNRTLLPPTPRALLGLPDEKFIFNSSNTIRKITAETFDLWMEILKLTDNSLLWMLGERPESNSNFIDSVAKAGVDPARVIFAPRATYNDHIARMPAADLGLDTFPCNGHTTTSDALWAGLPVLTKKGTNFASRVSESLLNALGIPELVATNDADFINMAVRLSQNPDELLAIRQRIHANRLMAPLFDSERSARHVEAAYRMMIERAAQGLPPDHLHVPAIPPRTKPFTLGKMTSSAQA